MPWFSCMICWLYKSLIVQVLWLHSLAVQLLKMLFLGLLALTTVASSATVDDCPGYSASNVTQSGNSLTASLSLAGDACNVYGNDISDLSLLVEYQTGM